MDGTDFDQRFERLLQAVLEGRVVPFVGAGFSLTAKSAASDAFKPTVSYLNQRLADFISDGMERALNPSEPAWESVWELFIQALHRDSLGELAEIAQWLSPDPKAVLNALHVGLFRTLHPTDSHRYLAYLVREGLIGEIITTNYDTCIETAYRRSFGQSCDLQCKHGNPSAGSHCDKGRGKNCEYARDQECNNFWVIHSLREYRKHGAQLFGTCRKRYPALRIYKINGCANDYSHCLCQSKKSTAVRILLTERELQDFGKEAWARDLLRDRARSRSLLFIGFGSQEPQVRHTVLALMEEFHSAKESRLQDDPKNGILLLPNAPFLVAYSSTLSFPQLQILSGFVQAHRPKNNPQDFLRTCFGNVFTGSDRTRFELGGKEEKLGADDFMRRLFQAVYRRLLERYSAKGSMFYKWLEKQTEVPGLWRETLISILYPKQNGTTSLFGRWPQLLEYRPAPQKSAEAKARYGPCVLWDWLNTVQRDAVPLDAHGRPGDYYLALNDDSLLILTFLTVLSALAGKKPVRLRKTAGIGLAIQSDALSRPIFLAHEQRQVRFEEARQENQVWVLDPEGMRPEDKAAEPLPRLLFILDLPSATYLEPEGRLKEMTSSNGMRSIRLVNYVRIPAANWIHAARAPGGLNSESLERVFTESVSKRRERPVRLRQLAQIETQEGKHAGKPGV